MKPTYEELEARCAALAAENAGLKSAIEKHADSYIMCGYCRTERDGKNDDVCEVLDSIPATDAFLAEMRSKARNEGINYAAGRLAAAFNHGFVDKPLAEVCDVVRMKGSTVVNCTDGDVPAKCAGFLESANPVTVLALLDELEKMQAQSSKWCEAFHKAVSVGARYEERIAELERNEIREEGNQFLVVRHPGKLPVVKHFAGELEGFLRQLLEHDPMATIDIVTHRYYGVGGQWVQDADEYLQMMAAAAGKGETS